MKFYNLSLPLSFYLFPISDNLIPRMERDAGLEMYGRDDKMLINVCELCKDKR